MDTFLEFQTVMLGDFEMMGILNLGDFKYTPTIPLPFRNRKRIRIIYDRRIVMSNFIQESYYQNLGKKYRNAVLDIIQQAVGVILGSMTYQQTRKELTEVDDDGNMLQLISSTVPVFVVVSKKEELEHQENYIDLLLELNPDINTELIRFFHVTVKTIDEVYTKMLQEMLQLMIDQHYQDDPRFSIFSMCAICKRDDQPVRFYSEFLICDSCDPENFDYEKFQTWIKIDR